MTAHRMSGADRGAPGAGLPEGRRTGRGSPAPAAHWAQRAGWAAGIAVVAMVLFLCYLRLSLRVPVGIRRRLDRAASLGHAARQPAAAALDRVGCLVLPGRAGPVRPGRSGVGTRAQRGPHRRGDDVHGAPPARRLARQGPRQRPGGSHPGPGRGGRHAGAGARRRAHAADEPRSFRQYRPRAACLADRGTAAGGPGRPGPLVRAARRGHRAGVGPVRRRSHPGHRRGADGHRVCGPGRRAARASPGSAGDAARLAVGGGRTGGRRDRVGRARAGGLGPDPARRGICGAAGAAIVRGPGRAAAQPEAHRRGAAGHLRRRLHRPAVGS